MNKQGFGYTVVFTFVVAFIFVALLAGANAMTVEQVRFNQQIRRQRAILTAMNIPYDTEEQVAEIFDMVEELESNGVTLLQLEFEGDTRYAKEVSGSGVWGTIRAVLGVQGNGERLLGLEILEHNETPGLGGRIDEDWFTRQFREKLIINGSIQFNEQPGEGDFDPDSGRVDRITGATGTSTSMRRIINNSLEELLPVLGGEQ
ncbi:MAG: FMN-binding protein [Spirochaetaceae bacterium]|nr:MAG: FMN-binding protein [Spirochaetaceae bacterium]